MTPPPFRVGLVVAADTIYSPAEVDAALGIVVDGCNWFREAAIRETGYALDYDVRAWRSTKTLLQLQTNDDGTFQHDADCTMPEGYHEGFAQNPVLRDVKAGLGWVDYEDPAMGGRNARWWVIVLQGGGVAGGSYQVDNWNGVLPYPAWSFGLVVLGDWGIYSTIFGYGSHCCVVKYGEGFCVPTPTKALGALVHEGGHGFGFDTHEEGWYIEDGNSPWSPNQKADFIARNQQFIYPVVVEPPPLPTIIDVIIDPLAPIVRVGQMIDIDTIAVYSDGSQANINHMDTLSILNARIASVDSEANTLTGKRQGTTELLVTYAGGMIQKHVPVAVKKRWWQ